MADPYVGEIRVSPKTGRRGQWDGTGWRVLPPIDTKSTAYGEGSKYVSGLRQSYDTYNAQRPRLAQADRMLSNSASTGKWDDRKVRTGGFVNAIQLPVLGKTRPVFSSDAGRFYDIGQQLQTGVRDPSKDAQVSNYERELLGSTSPSLVRRVDDNRDIIAQRTAGIDAMRDRAEFYSDYLNAYGTIEGADALWNSYLEAYPYYGPSKNNPERYVAKVRPQGHWRQHVWGERFKDTARPKPQSSPPKKQAPTKRKRYNPATGKVE